MAENLETRLGYKFRNSLLLAEAMTHPSLAFESHKPHFDNQRLEFLGDAVLQLVLTDCLYAMFSEFPEGRLTKLRSRLVSRESLVGFARRLGLGSFVMLGKGEEATGGRSRCSTLEDAFEALVGAVYLDGGFEVVKDLVLRLFQPEIARLASSPQEKNPKGELQECLQAIHPQAPEYEVLGESGPDHRKTFRARVLWMGRELARGQGASKKEAEVRAAQAALQERCWEHGVEEKAP